jgi:hypothetical protein
MADRPVISALDLLRGPSAPDQPVQTGGLDPDIPVVEIQDAEQASE